MDIIHSAKAAAGEVFVPILSGTLTTLAPFFPLAFWPGVVGKFMYYIPVTLIITLFASLIVAYAFNPVFAISFMKPDEKEGEVRDRKAIMKTGLIILGVSAFFYIPGFAGDSKFFIGLANLGVFIAISYVLHNFYMYKFLLKFQQVFIPRMLDAYERVLRWTLKGKRPQRLLWELIILFFVSMVIFSFGKSKLLFFPEGDPATIFVSIKMPVGTEVKTTDSVTRIVENRIFSILGESNPIVESVISNVALGASTDMFNSGTITSNLGKITINFVEFAKRHREKTTPYIDKIRNSIKDIPGAEITVDKENMGPPVGKPVNIEVSSENLDELIVTTENLIKYIDSVNIGGIEELKSDFESKKPELIIEVDRQRANREGITTAQIGSELRTAILGTEVTKYRVEEDQYPVQLRYNEYLRENIDRLMNMKITFMDLVTGRVKSIPLSSVATVKYQNAYGGINRKDLKRVITVSSNLLSGYTSNEINTELRNVIKSFNKPQGTEIMITGEQEDQAENMVFLSKAMFLSLFLVLFILITQFNSLSKPIIIISEVIFSIIGVLLGFTLFGMDFSVIMTGMGVVALAGIVVRNGILLVEFTDKLIEQGVRTQEAIIQAGKIRITPIVLTATATILGLIPLAIGFNINFSTLLTDLNPQIHVGGDTRQFFGPLAWTIIFGLSFATILTLVFIPVMYKLLYTWKLRIKRRTHWRKLKRENNKLIGA
jgi:multidrug efflux pump subunit AcrB